MGPAFTKLGGLLPRLDCSQRVIERQEAPRHPPPEFFAVIPIGVFTLIDAGMASSSPFQRTMKIVHDHAGIVFTSAGVCVHDALETVTTNSRHAPQRMTAHMHSCQSCAAECVFLGKHREKTISCCA